MTDQKRRILMIDDNPDFLTALGKRLEVEGFEVVTMTSSDEGIAAATSQPFDLILVDMLMPDADGVSTYRELREHAQTKTVPIILLTGVAVEGHWEPMKNTDDTHAFVMGKPYDHAPLIARINEVLTQASGGL